MQLQILPTLKTQSHVISSTKISLVSLDMTLSFSELCPYIIYGPCFLYPGDWFISCGQYAPFQEMGSQRFADQEMGSQRFAE